jgi:hypothetical protein
MKNRDPTFTFEYPRKNSNVKSKKSILLSFPCHCKLSTVQFNLYKLRLCWVQFREIERFCENLRKL